MWWLWSRCQLEWLLDSQTQDKTIQILFPGWLHKSEARRLWFSLVKTLPRSEAFRTSRLACARLKTNFGNAQCEIWPWRQLPWQWRSPLASETKGKIVLGKNQFSLKIRTKQNTKYMLRVTGWTPSLIWVLAAQTLKKQIQAEKRQN